MNLHVTEAGQHERTNQDPLWPGVTAPFGCHVDEDICVVCFSLGLEHISPLGNDRIAGVMCCKGKPSEMILLLSSL